MNFCMLLGFSDGERRRVESLSRTYGGEHVPWVEEQERHGEVEDVCCHEGDDQGLEGVVSKEIRHGEIGGRCNGLLYGLDGDKDRGKHEVSAKKSVNTLIVERVQIARDIRTS